MNRLALFESALESSRAHALKWGDHVAILSIIAQLEYLIEVETGREQDRSRLEDIIIGLLAVREIEVRDLELAHILYSVGDEARKLGSSR